MTEAEREALIHQINRHAHLSSHQMESVMGALHPLKWEPKMGQTETARCEPPDGTKDGTYHVHVNGGAKRVCLWRNQRWYNFPGQNSQTAGEAGRDGWRYSHAMSLDPPHPHDAVRDAVVAAAMTAYRQGWLPRHIDEVAKKCLLLCAAQTPPDPAKELRRAMAAVRMIGPTEEVAAHLEIAIDRAIAALEQGNAT